MYVLFTIWNSLAHLSIFILLSIILFAIYKRNKGKKQTIKIISVFLVLLTLISYFVGTIADSKIQFDTYINTNQEEFFYVSSNDNSYCYYGKIYVFDKNKDDINYNELFDDSDAFQLGLSKTGKYIFDKRIGLKQENKDGNIITYSPVVLLEGNFLIGRNNYAGYITIENDDKITVIPYELWFKESYFNYITFMKIYSDEFKINLSEIQNNVFSREIYMEKIY